jgi:hypothetical protein
MVIVTKKAVISNIVHWLDDFLMAGCSSANCLHIVKTIEFVSAELGIPLSEEKNTGPVTK